MKSLNQKTELRSLIKNQRQNVESGQIAKWNKLIFKHGLNLIDWPKIKSLHIYLPIKEQNEVDSWPFIKMIWQKWPNITVAVPRIKNSSLEAVVLNPDTKLKNNRFGITEPVGGKVLLSDHKFDVIIVPTLGFDKHGYRLGYGGGYYDRFLASQPDARTIGLCYEMGLVENLQHEPGDIRLKQIITEHGAKLRV